MSPFTTEVAISLLKLGSAEPSNSDAFVLHFPALFRRSRTPLLPLSGRSETHNVIKHRLAIFKIRKTGNVEKKVRDNAGMKATVDFEPLLGQTLLERVDRQTVEAF
ncbi:hypothetical protein AWB75_07132 [Caballeronia catudaia]|uniref:Uncharacterized protein n=1 Tax=Caballeronia catudaia TaxID=1777136 RepID=A0A158DSN6_9BURK|nr:hypothetical protein [Caballeronia catudaia]SAK97595.1 hypothetical protein AWB75_07132 [Caballeronia catudaia]